MRATSLLLTLLVLLGALACNRSEPEEPAKVTVPSPTPTPINPQALLQEAGSAMAALDSFSFRLEHEDGGTPLGDNLTLVSVEGSIVKPDKISIDFNGAAGGFAFTSSLITIGDDSFMTNPINGEWGIVPKEVSSFAFFDPQLGISAIMGKVEQPTLVSANANTYTVSGTLRSEAFVALFGETAQGSPVSIEAVIRVEDLRLTRATLSGLITPNEEEGLVRTIRLSNFDEPVEIVPPQIDATQ